MPAHEARVLGHFDLTPSYDLPTVVLADLRALGPPGGGDARAPRKARAYRLRDWRPDAAVDAETIVAFEDALFAGALATQHLSAPERAALTLICAFIACTIVMGTLGAARDIARKWGAFGGPFECHPIVMPNSTSACASP